MKVRENLRKLLDELPSSVRLVAVSKTIPTELILEVYNAGQRLFGENRAQELISKQPLLPSDIEWHFIGHLQTNKIKYIVPFVSMIESVDRLKLLLEINKEAIKYNRTISCLLQFHIATEETKFGLDIQEAEELLTSAEYQKCRNIRIVGVMGMATFTDDTNRVRKEFRMLKNNFDMLGNRFFNDADTFKEISMGMSGDYRIAIEEGSTMVRIGSAIFGDRLNKPY